ncbi:MAG: hypothetical protein ABIH20_05850 [Candidatus Diapherotrites archaeon]
MADYTHFISLRNEEKQRMRTDPNYRDQVNDDLAKAIDSAGASLKQTLGYIANVDYKGSVDDLREKLEEEGFGPERIRVSLRDTLRTDL